MKSNFLNSYLQSFEKIEGAFQFDAALMFMAYNQLIRSQGISGDVLEIGVLHGLSSIAVAALRGEGRRFLAIDLFADLQSENVSLSGAGDKESFMRNMRGFYNSTESLQLLQCNSADLNPSDLGYSFAFCHIDGGHSSEETYHDLQLCHEVMLPGGILALDDYFNPTYPGVSEGAFRFHLEHPGALHPIAIGFNKVLFQKPGPPSSLNATFATTFSYIPKTSTMLWNVPVNLFWSRFQYFFDLARSTSEQLVRTSDNDLRAVYEPEVSSLSARPGEIVHLPITVTNRSEMVFQGDGNTFGLSYHLLSSCGVMLRQDHARNFFKEPLNPGEARVVELSIVAPEKQDTYLVEMDIVWEGVTWFKDKGNPTSIIRLTVLD